jgi:virulence factor Mce-like protein
VIKQAPSFGRIAAMTIFALSCFGILIYLWLTFGGATPLKPEGYRVQIDFPEATTLAQEADVRISGVPVGRVKLKERKGALTRVTLELKRKYAPIPSDTRATLRQKTLLGETFVELTPGSKGAPKVPDNGVLKPGHVAQTVELDEIFRAFDKRTRGAFRTWMVQQGIGYGNRGKEINDTLGNLDDFAQNVDKVLQILDSQQESTRTLIRDTGVVFDALTERKGQLRELVRNSNRVFAATAARDQELADTFRVLPTFLDESKATVERTTTFAKATDPLVTQLRPAARELSPTLIALNGLAPDLKAFFRDLGPLIRVSRTGLPATERFLNDTRPLLDQLDPFLRNLNPVLDYAGNYKKEIAAFFALDAAATQATDSPPGAPAPIHYLRTTNPLNPENLAVYPKRISTNRSNPYVEPGGYAKLPTGLEVFGTYLCTNNPVPILGTFGGFIPESTRALLDQFVYASGQGTPAPECKEQRPLGRLVGQSGKYPHVLEQPPGRR